MPELRTYERGTPTYSGYSLIGCIRSSGNWILCLAVLLSVSVEDASSQDRRRALRTPGLVVETGVPIGRTHSLRFTKNGEQLLIAGGDKVARLWRFKDGSLDRTNAKLLRWPAWREQRGTIYATAMSQDREQRFVAVAGHGMVTGAIAILNRETQQLVFALTKPDSDAVVASLEFLSDGKLAYGTVTGEIRVWHYNDGNRVVSLGRHLEKATQIKAIARVNPDHFISVAANGSVMAWRLSGGTGTKLFDFNLRSITSAKVDGDHIVAVGTLSDLRGAAELRNMKGDRVRQLRFGSTLFPSSVAYHRESQTIAIGAQERTNANDLIWKSSLMIHDFEDAKTRRTQFKSTTPIYALDFHSEGKFVAAGGGDDSEVRIVNVVSGKVIDTVAGAGGAIWQVGFSADGKSIGFRDQKNASPSSLLDTATGKWRRFDLTRRDWSRSDRPFTPTLARKSMSDWKIIPDKRDPFVWYAVHQNGKKLKLPLDREIDLAPQCYTFLNTQTKTSETHVAVGHRWGVSVFALRNTGVTRIRLFVGHSDDVTYVAPSRDGKLLISCSRDQTIAAWSLAPWDHQRELGANFSRVDDTLQVANVVEGSPAWEAGLIRSDRLQLLAFDGAELQGGPTKWRERLRSPVPGKELFFRVKRPGVDADVDMLTTVRQRPLWKFFCTRDGEWVLWRWRDYFYDTSTRGDSFIGWQTIGGVGQTPIFETAEKFRRLFHQPEKVVDVLEKTRFNPERVAFPELIPPEVSLTLAKQGDEQHIAKVSVAARGVEVISSEPSEVSLWVNDHKYKTWTHFGSELNVKVAIPDEVLRSGSNSIVAQAYNRAGVRSDSSRREIDLRRERKRKPTLHTLAIGISNYRQAARGADGRVLWGDLLFAAADATTMAQSWSKQASTPMYHRANVQTLIDEEATRAVIRQKLKRLSQTVRADDVFVLFMAGHGYARKVRGSAFEPGSFVFVCPDFDVRRAKTTGLASRDLYGLINQLPCRKLLLLDCCHSGSTNTLREFSPEGIGPIILAACQSSEQSYDIPYLGHGAFSNSILEAVGKRFSRADVDLDEEISANELFSYVSQRVRDTIRFARPVLGDDAVQTPMASLGVPQDSLPLVGQAIGK